MTRRSVTPIQRRSIVRTQWSVADEDTSKNQGSSLNSISQAVAPGPMPEPNPRGLPVRRRWRGSTSWSTRGGGRRTDGPRACPCRVRIGVKKILGTAVRGEGQSWYAPPVPNGGSFGRMFALLEKSVLAGIFPVVATATAYLHTLIAVAVIRSPLVPTNKGR